MSKSGLVTNAALMGGYPRRATIRSKKLLLTGCSKLVPTPFARRRQRPRNAPALHARFAIHVAVPFGSLARGGAKPGSSD